MKVWLYGDPETQPKEDMLPVRTPLRCFAHMPAQPPCLPRRPSSLLDAALLRCAWQALLTETCKSKLITYFCTKLMPIEFEARSSLRHTTYFVLACSCITPNPPIAYPLL